jgi:hypothetical protein
MFARLPAPTLVFIVAIHGFSFGPINRSINCVEPEEDAQKRRHD